ncbi:MAG: SHOCT domain-containing protein [Candidatus Hydrogenedentales bacterium]
MREDDVLSVKPGRGPSAMSAVGGIIGVAFGIFWTVTVFEATKGAPFPLVHTFFPFFGILFIVFGIATVIYSLTNTVSRDRMSVVDITTGEEESDPISRLIVGVEPRAQEQAHSENIEGRLAKLESLLEEHAITNAEYLEQRKRILEEI